MPFFFSSSIINHCRFFNTGWRIERASTTSGFQGFFFEDKERVIKTMERVTSFGFNKDVERMENPLDSSVKEDEMGTGRQSLDVLVSAFPSLGPGLNKSDLFEFLGVTEEDIDNLLYFIERVRQEAMNKPGEFVNGSHPFTQFPWFKKSVDLMGLNMMDVNGGLTLVDCFKEVTREFMKKMKLCSVYYPSVPAFPVLGLSIPKKQRSNGRKKKQCSTSCPVPPFPVLLLSVPKKQRSNRGKPLIATIGTGFLSKFGAPVLKDFETRFSDAEPRECRRNKSQKRYRESEESEEEKLNKPKRQKDGKNQNNKVMAQLAEWGLVPPPNMPTEFKNLIEEMGGSEEKLLIQKIIFKTDLSKSHNRLQIPENQLMADFLTVEEERKLDEKGLNVSLIEPCLKKSEIHLTKWNMKNSRVFVFNEQWNSVVDGNQSTLKKNAVMQIWSFRTAPESKLCFAMVKVKDGDDY
ncbi:hypothetical protein SLEP1_g18392 [Rubroshorea leprosula]|uniref:B3 domain-containing protein n=1 Tax=Rubroshorea leprosula TaxID=152421 RepID=A0AAV5J4Y3_9ROSI|nr:hypothetical protein SLEP1_g18392 [Rubroshorea leprosula]